MKWYENIVKAFDNKDEQEQSIDEYWNIYNAKPDENLTYSGNSIGYVPIVRGAINARSKRVLKQLFPQNNKHVSAVTDDEKTPYTQMALLEHYIRKTQLKEIVRSDLVAGDVSGQWCLMVDWVRSSRLITNLVRRNPIVEQINGEDVKGLGLHDPTVEEEDLEEEEIFEEGPDVVDFNVQDLAVIPPTCNNLQKAEVVAVRLRMTRDKVQEMIDEDVFILPENMTVDDFCKPDRRRDKRNPTKKQTNDAGIKTDGTTHYALIFCAYGKLPFDGKNKPEQEGIAFFSGPSEIVGLIRNPLWSGRRPIICEPVERIKGSFFGKSKVEPVKFMQWQACDFHNMGQDSAMYSVLPVVAADPLTNPNWQGLVMGLGAVWPIAPGDVKLLNFGALWKDADLKVETLKRQIWEALDVNEMMMGMMPKGRKNNAMIGGFTQEQSTNITDHASRYEEVMLNPLLEMLFEFDQQYRTKELMISTRGEIGYKAAIEVIPVQQWGQRIIFQWTGSEYMMGLQRAQQQVGFMNVLKGIPPQMLNGKQVDITPIIEAMTEIMFTPDLAPRILKDTKSLFTVPAEIENEAMANGQLIMVHEADDDPQHLQAHIHAANTNGDPQAIYKQHILAHMAQLQKKREMQAGQQQAKGMPGGPGGMGPGGGPAPGVAGTPRPGALPAPPRGGQNPPGAINADQMADPMAGARG